MIDGPTVDVGASLFNLPTWVVGRWFDPIRFGVVVGWYLFVVWTVGAAARDARRRRLSADAWLFGVSTAGLFGLFPMILVDYFPLGVIFAFVLFFPLLYGYIVAARNPYAPAAERLLTDDHLAEVGKTLLQGVGFSLGSAAGGGPAIRIQASRDVTRDRLLASHLPLLERTIAAALQAHASELAFELSRDRFIVKHRIDGVWMPTETTEASPPLFELAYRLSGGKTVDAKKSAAVHYGASAVRINGKRELLNIFATAPAVKRRLHVRLPTHDLPSHVSSLGLNDRDRAVLMEAVQAQSGLILIASTPGSGRWTTLQACIGDIDLLMRSTAVVEEPHRPYRGKEPVDRYSVDPNHAAGYSAAVRAALAKNPQVLVCGRAAGAEALQLVIDAARDRLVLVGVDAKSALEGLAFLSSFNSSRDKLADRLNCVFSQRLPRRLCKNCREAYHPLEDAVRKANLGDLITDRLYRCKAGTEPICETCGGVGYKGCQPLYEFLPLGDRIRGLIRSNASERELLLEARKAGMESHAETAMKLLASGATSADELRRVLQSASANGAE